MPSSGGQTSALDRKSTRLNSSHGSISYAVFCLEKQENRTLPHGLRAFRHRSFLLLFLVQLIPTSGLTYRLTGSAFYLGLAGFALLVFFLVLGPPPGFTLFPLSTLSG